MAGRAVVLARVRHKPLCQAVMHLMRAAVVQAPNLANLAVMVLLGT